VRCKTLIQAVIYWMPVWWWMAEGWAHKSWHWPWWQTDRLTRSWQ